MCLIVLAYRVHPDFPLIVAANRDEFYARPTLPAAFWPAHPQLLAGQDGLSGGTWLGMTRNGRFAAVTNVRRGGTAARGERSRGCLVRDFLAGTGTPEAFMAGIAGSAAQYGGFNLLVADSHELLCHHSLTGDTQLLEPGYHGLSNDRLGTPWPKLTRSLQHLQQAVERGPDAAALQGILRDESRPADHELPDTGIGLDHERLLASPFIRSADYGTRACTTLTVDRHGHTVFIEQGFGALGSEGEPRVFRFRMDTSHPAHDPAP